MVGSDVVDFKAALEAKQNAKHAVANEVPPQEIPAHLAKKLDETDKQVDEFFNYLMDKLNEKNEEDISNGKNTDIMIPLEALLMTVMKLITDIDKAGGMPLEEIETRMTARDDLSEILQSVAGMFARDTQEDNTYGKPLYHHDIYFGMIIAAITTLKDQQAMIMAREWEAENKAEEDKQNEQQTETVSEKSDN